MKWIREEHTKGLFQLEGIDIWIQGSLESENYVPQFFFCVNAQGFFLEQFDRMIDAVHLAEAVYKELSQPCPKCNGERMLKDKPANFGFHQGCRGIPNGYLCTWHAPFEIQDPERKVSFNEYENQAYRITQ